MIYLHGFVDYSQNRYSQDHLQRSDLQHKIELKTPEPDETNFCCRWPNVVNNATWAAVTLHCERMFPTKQIWKFEIDQI